MSSAATAPATGAKPLSFMEKLDPLVSVYRPSDTVSSSGADKQPRLIIMASWTGARDAHIAKYIVKYQALYPAAQILLLKSFTSQIISPAQIGPAMRHAVPIVRAAFPAKATSSSPELLIHIFSNGGSGSIANLYEQYATMAGPDEDKRLPPHVTIFDSCPGLWSIPHAVVFASVGLAPWQKIAAAPIFYALAAAFSGGMTLGLLPDSLGDWGKAHNHNDGNKAELRRTYIYSAADDLIDHKAVEAHAAEAKDKGFTVELEKYEGSAHVAHLRQDENRYWQIVRRTMEGAAVAA